MLRKCCCHFLLPAPPPPIPLLLMLLLFLLPLFVILLLLWLIFFSLSYCLLLLLLLFLFLLIILIFFFLFFFLLLFLCDQVLYPFHDFCGKNLKTRSSQDIQPEMRDQKKLSIPTCSTKVNFSCCLPIPVQSSDYPGGVFSLSNTFFNLFLSPS